MTDVHSTSGDLLPLDAVRTSVEGWKLVPVEPTAEMWKAADEIDNRMFAGGSSHGAETGQIWEAMLDAAPTPPLGAVSVPGETAAGAQKQDHPSEIAELEQEASLMRARNERLQQERDALLEVVQAIGYALRMGMPAAAVLDENSPIRDAMRDAIAKAGGAA